MRLHELFGTSCKAAKTLYQIAQCCRGMNCSSCPLKEICFLSQEDYEKWLEASTGFAGEAVVRAEPVIRDKELAASGVSDFQSLEGGLQEKARVFIDLSEYSAPEEDARCYAMTRLCGRLAKEGRMNDFPGAYAGMFNQMLCDAGFIEKRGKNTKPLEMGLRIGIRENTWLDERADKERRYCSYPYALSDLYLKIFAALRSGATVEVIGELAAR